MQGNLNLKRSTVVVVDLFRVTLGRSPQVAPKHNMADIYPDYEPGLYVGLENDFLLESGQGDPIFLLGDFLPGSFQNFCQNSSKKKAQGLHPVGCVFKLAILRVSNENFDST